VMTAALPYITGSVVSRDGTTIAYRQVGHGPGVVLVHGGIQASQNFMRLAEALADAFTVYVPDRRGRGLSGPHGAGYCLRKECEDIDALLAKTGAGNIFGLSSGAIISLQAALTLPSVRRAAIYEPPLSVDGSSPTEWIARFDREIAQGRLPSALVTVIKGVQAGPVTDAMPRAVLTPLLRLALLADERNVGAGDIPLRQLIPTMHFDLQLVKETESQLDRYAAIPANVLLLGGSKSQKFLRQTLDALNVVVAQAKRVEFAGLDHMGPDNRGKPGIVAAELRRFFSSAEA
jgi:pimeloyl-ACP methyl ester carboxylesterase